MDKFLKKMVKPPSSSAGSSSSVAQIDVRVEENAKKKSRIVFDEENPRSDTRLITGIAKGRSRYCQCNETWKSRRRMTKNAVTNLHHYHVEIFNTVIDRVLLELNERFSETSTELLLCVSCLDPRDNFAAFDKKKLLRLAELYPSDFSEIERELLAVQLDIYILDMRSSPEFSKVNGISGLLKKLVVLRRHNQYVWVFKLLKFACLLPVATASVERVFSAMKIIKNRLRNKIGDGFVSDCLITFIERDVVATISNETIMERFQNMHTRRISNK